MRIKVPMIQLFLLIRFLLSVTALSACFFYLLLAYSFFDAFICTLLIWSLYVLGVPGSHGVSLIGFPLAFVYKEQYLVEPYVWTVMALLNVVILIFAPTYYMMTFPTTLLYLIITHPYPCSIIFITSFIGTFFYYCLGNRPVTATHLLLRQLTILFGYLVFLYFSHKHVVTLLGISVNP